MNNAFIAKYFDWDCRAPKPKYWFINRVLRKFIKQQLVPASFTWSMANVEARMNMFHLAEQTTAHGVRGDMVEACCNSGESSVVLQEILSHTAPDKTLHVFDSFRGLPELKGHDAEDGVYGKGNMIATRDRLVRRFESLGLKLPEIHEGWVEDTIPAGLPESISFALFDCDIYAATRHILPRIYERMSKGAIGMFGIYYDANVFRRDDTIPEFRSPGAKRAADEFFLDKPESVHVLYANEYTNGYFRKL